MAKALYRKYRSKSLDEIVGQSHVTDILRRALDKGNVAHAYLLTGPRGVGKTSIARILAHEINGLPYSEESTHLDIIEIDAASNNGVDDVRDLREKVQIAPVSAAKKVYIIDEVHMLSKPAFNALLKTLEEPPDHVVFILATTNIEKIPDTIISRTQRFGFRSISQTDIVKHLQEIADKEKIIIDDASLQAIALRGDGSFRDSISLLDQLSSLADDNTGITLDLVEATLGLASHTTVNQLLDAVLAKNTSAIMTLLAGSTNSGIQASVLIDQLISEVSRRMVDSPQLVELLDGLLLASDSSKPHLKLLTVLLSQAGARPKTTTTSSAALATHAPTISSPAVQKVVVQKPVARSTPRSVVHTPAISVVSVAPTAQPAQPATPVFDSSQPRTVGVLDWEKLVEYTRVNHVALHSVLSKCSYELHDDTLILYTVRKFNKTKLDDAKYRLLLAQCLIETGAGDLLVETIPTAAPPKDSTAAAVAAIMGGGEEVTVDG